MNLISIWVKDPNTNEYSVSLTLVVLSATMLIIAMGLEMTDVIKSTSMAFEFFGASSGLYWGRRWASAKGQTLSKD